MATQFAATDPNGVLITCNKRNWLEHIVERHPEMAAQETAVVATIERPLAIYQDANRANRRVFYRQGVLPHPFNRAYLRVVVEYRRHRAGERGHAVTAFAVLRPKRGETILWP